LPAALFKPTGSRLLWLPVHLGVIGTATVALASGWIAWPLVPVLSVVIGMSFAGLMFVGHELLHGAIIRSRKWNWLRPWLGWVCFAPFLLSQRLWIVWHNRSHHANPNALGADPDMYPSLSEYEDSAMVRFTTDNFALGGHRKRGILSLLLGFLIQSQWVLRQSRERFGLTTRVHRLIQLEVALALALWVGLALLVGPLMFVFTYAIPLVVADVIVMAFILTNHSLSPATDVNDPLLNSLSVTTPRLLDWLTLDFGYHVEHHMFPSMSARHGRRVRDALRERWPERYQSLPILTALHRLYRTGRVYKDDTTIVDPRTHGEFATLAPRDLAR